MNTRGKQSLYDNLEQNEELVTHIDTAIRYTRKAEWKQNGFKTRKVKNAVEKEMGEYATGVDAVMDIIKNQPEYD